LRACVINDVYRLAAESRVPCTGGVSPERVRPRPAGADIMRVLPLYRRQPVAVASLAAIAMTTLVTTTHITAASKPGMSQSVAQAAELSGLVIPVTDADRLFPRRPAAASPAAGSAAASREGTASFAASTQTDLIAPKSLCTDDLFGLSITVGNHTELANSVVTYHVYSAEPQVVIFGTSTQGLFGESIDVPVALDGTGSGQSSTFIVKGYLPGFTTVEGCSEAPTLGCLGNPREVSVTGITSVEFMEMDSPLDPNPGPGGGVRIYPEKQTPNDGVDRKTVRVKALATDAKPGLGIFFKSFDVDDPSRDAKPVDSNGGAGNDNFGTVPALDGVAYTDATGAAEQTFTVSTRPGDNYRVAASCNQGYLSQLHPAGIQISDADGQILPTNGRAGVTDLLTVWRKVHVEVDSMGPVIGNRVTGTVSDADPNTFSPTSDVTLQINGSRRLERHRFVGGVLKIDGLGDFKVVDNTATDVEVSGLLQAEAIGRSFVLVDDDDFNGDDGTAYDGDENENLFAPQLSYLNDSMDNGICDGSDRNVFGAAYICPVFDIGDNNDFVPFVVNTASDSASKIATYDFDEMAHEADPDFWSIYVLGAYQGDLSTDFDNEDGGILGSVDDINGVGASIFLEPISDGERSTGVLWLGCSTPVVLAHEIGHLFGGQHKQGGLMGTPCKTIVTEFSDATINTIRTIGHP
jgi:hypothetical protein